VPRVAQRSRDRVVVLEEEQDVVVSQGREVLERVPRGSDGRAAVAQERRGRRWRARGQGGRGSVDHGPHRGPRRPSGVGRLDVEVDAGAASATPAEAHSVAVPRGTDLRRDLDLDVAHRQRRVLAAGL